MRSNRRAPKPYTQMTARELDAATAEFDAELVADRFGPMPPAARARWQRARGKLAGRPRVGRGAKVISVSVERELLDLSDRLARKRGLTRASLIARGLRAILAAEGFGLPSHGKTVDD